MHKGTVEGTPTLPRRCFLCDVATVATLPSVSTQQHLDGRVLPGRGVGTGSTSQRKEARTQGRGGPGRRWEVGALANLCWRHA